MLLGLALGSRQSYGDWLGFGRDLVACGMRGPVLLVADGARDLECDLGLGDTAERQRCTLHVFAI